MAALFANDVRGIEGSFYDVLEHAPGSKEEKQSFFLTRYNVRVPRQNYALMWDRLAEILGRAKAGEALFDYILSTASGRLRELLTIALEDEPVDILSRDPLLVSDLFWENGNPRRICEHLLDYMKETGFEWSETDIKADSMLPDDSVIKYEFDIALSFAGEQRPYVKRVADTLKSKGVRVFYDDFEEEELWGEDLVSHLDMVFRKRARFCMVFISREYADKAWPRHEARSALARAVEAKNVYILPVRFDDTDLPGLQPSIKYLSAKRYSPERIAAMALRKMQSSRII